MANQLRTPLIATLLFLSFSLYSHSALSSSDSLSPSPSPVAQLADDFPPHPPSESPVPSSDTDSPPSETPSPSRLPVRPSDSTYKPPSTADDTQQSPSPASYKVAEEVADEHELKEKRSDHGGMSSGKMAGIAVGVVIGACAVGFAGFVYKKREDNVRRSNYGYDARSSMI